VLAFWVRTSNRAPDIHALAVATVDFYDTHGKFVGGAAVERGAPLTDGWTELTYSFGPGGTAPWPAETASVIIGFGGGGWTDNCEVGRQYGVQAFDDVSFAAIQVFAPDTGTGRQHVASSPRLNAALLLLVGTLVLTGGIHLRMARQWLR
jgi:hypothetical protein